MWLKTYNYDLHYYPRVISAEAYQAPLPTLPPSLTRAPNLRVFPALQPRLHRNPFFIIPCFRDKGIFNVVTNNQVCHHMLKFFALAQYLYDVLVQLPVLLLAAMQPTQPEYTVATHLDEWQQKQGNAEAHVVISFFTELIKSKELVLVRSEIKESAKIMNRTPTLVHASHSLRYIPLLQDAKHITDMVLKYYTLPDLYEYVQAFNQAPQTFDYHVHLELVRRQVQKDDIAITERKNERVDRPLYKPPPEFIVDPDGWGNNSVDGTTTTANVGASESSNISSGKDSRKGNFAGKGAN
eukprot:gene11043-297_t